jgi:hypothetical protein
MAARRKKIADIVNSQMQRRKKSGTQAQHWRLAMRISKKRSGHDVADRCDAS